MAETATNPCDKLGTWLMNHHSWFELETFEKFKVILEGIHQLSKIPNEKLVQTVTNIRIQISGIESLYDHSDVPNQKWRPYMKGLLEHDLKNLIKLYQNSLQLPYPRWFERAEDLLQKITKFNNYSDTNQFVQAMIKFKDELLDIGTQWQLSYYSTYDMYREHELSDLVHEFETKISGELVNLTKYEMNKLEQLGWLDSVDVEENDGMLFLTAEATVKFRKTTKLELYELNFWAEKGKIQLESGQSIETPPDFKKLIELAESFYQLSYDKY